jgi:hypothetical protein
VQVVTEGYMPSCRRCRGTQFRMVPQTFRDGTKHRRAECAACGRFLRYLPRRDGTAQRQALPVVPLAAQAPRPSRPIQVEILSVAPGRRDLGSAVERARQSLAWLTDTAADLQRRLSAGEWSDGEPLTLELVAGVCAAAGTAAVLLDPARIAEKAKARREGRMAT